MAEVQDYRLPLSGDVAAAMRISGSQRTAPRTLIIIETAGQPFELFGAADKAAGSGLPLPASAERGIDLAGNEALYARSLSGTVNAHLRVLEARRS